MRVLLLLLSCAAVELTKETWTEATAGKTVFVKFYAPWCGHCKTIKPHWDKLMAKFEDHATTMVADVDCIGDGKALCDANGVQGFPTIKYGDPNALEDYEGGREFEDLQTFAEELKPSCSPLAIELCDDDKKALIQKYQAMDPAELDTLIAEGDKELEEAEATFTAAVEELQSDYEKMNKEKEQTLSEIKANGLSLMKSVVAYFENRGCEPKSLEGCSEKETKYVEKMQAKGGLEKEKTRLEGMGADKMKPEQKQWLNERIALLAKMLEE